MELTRVQVQSFLDEVRSFPALPEDPARLTPAIEHYAALTDALLEKHFQLLIPREYSGVVLLDKLLNAMHEAMRLRGLAGWFSREPNQESADLICASIGSLCGEIFRNSVPGTWQFTEFKKGRYIALVTAGGAKYAPIQKAGKQFQSGKQDSILMLFGLGLVFAKHRAKLEKLSPEEREALRQKARQKIEERKAAARARKNNPKGLQ